MFVDEYGNPTPRGNIIKLPSCVCDVEFIKLVGRLMDEAEGSKSHRIIGK